MISLLMDVSPSNTVPTPAVSNLIAKGGSSPWNEEQAKVPHTFVANALFACKRARSETYSLQLPCYAHIDTCEGV